MAHIINNWELQGWEVNSGGKRTLECPNCHYKYMSLGNFVNKDTQENILLCHKCEYILESK